MIKSFLFLISFQVLGFSQSIVPGAERLNEDDPARKMTLLTEMSCLNCHQQQEHSISSKKGPQLNELGSRVRKDWLVQFLKDPQKIKPGTTMPNLFKNDPLANEKIQAISHYLLDDREKKKHKLPRLNQRSHGKVLYHRLGCVACHGESPIVLESFMGYTKPLGNLKNKYSLASLTKFLKDPLKYRPSGRMPSFQLSTDDASHIAAYLLERKEMNSHINPNPIEKVSAKSELVEKGKVYFEKMGCAHCHEKKGAKTMVGFKSWHELDFKNKGCLNGNGKVTYDLSSDQKQSLESIELKALNDPEIRLKHTFASLNCYACHSRDEIGGPLPKTIGHFHGEESLGDEGRLPPKLNDTGRKFNLEWIHKVLEGKGASRPTLETKMPDFGKENISHLPKLFEKLDIPKEEKGIVELKGGQAQIGKLLIGSKGMNCIMCHNFKDRNSTGIPALNIAYASNRYRPIWFTENLIHPNQLRPGTLMPSFWPGGKSTQMDVLNGNTELQIASIWAYLKDPEGYPDGYPPPKSKFELIPSDRPVVLRTFMEETGVKSVVVGQPNKVHYSYDSEQMQLGKVWKGRFIDGYNTWYNRFAPFEQPLGEIVASFSTQTFFLNKNLKPWPQRSPKEMGYEYRGYTLNQKGEPTFVMTYQGNTIEDRYAPHDNGKGMTRYVLIHGEGKLWFNPNQSAHEVSVKTKFNYMDGVAELDLSKGEVRLEMEIKWEK